MAQICEKRARWRARADASLGNIKSFVLGRLSDLSYPQVQIICSQLTTQVLHPKMAAIKFLSFSLLLPAALAAPSWPGYPSHAPHGSWPGSDAAAKAAYFLDDDPSGSSIVSLRIGENGHLSDPIRTSTEGQGSIGTNTTGFPNAVDALSSQSAVEVSGDVSPSVSSSFSAPTDCSASLHGECWQQHRSHVSH